MTFYSQAEEEEDGFPWENSFLLGNLSRNHPSFSMHFLILTFLNEANDILWKS